ncbi:Capsid protein VP1 [Frankliniella fusca]|uniref:Capsid protein VP1 n=1 Tax=Frankliniella fusca TaxID=407009 RepID=A0AAE1GVF1_9NEOP|nr:Capsid protein VP1 [Frankliniella fusca]
MPRTEESAVSWNTLTLNRTDHRLTGSTLKSRQEGGSTGHSEGRSASGADSTRRALQELTFARPGRVGIAQVGRRMRPSAPEPAQPIKSPGIARGRSKSPGIAQKMRKIVQIYKCLCK